MADNHDVAVHEHSRVHVAVSRSSRPWADWLGFAGFVVFAAWMLSSPRSVGIFLVIPVLYELGIAATFLVRGRAERSIGELLPRAVAYASTFLIPMSMWLMLRWHPSLVTTSPGLALQVAGASLWLFGLVVGFWPLWHLRGSFSVEPAARRLVTTGPYQMARHPIYMSYLLSFVGLLLLHLTATMMFITALWFAITCIRMRFEEQVLTAAFPEYRAYRRRVGALGPRVWRRAGSGDAVPSDESGCVQATTGRPGRLVGPTGRRGRREVEGCV
jgi:protein-S-isoprenylcysteine O-methyltransferase Ste14